MHCMWFFVIFVYMKKICTLGYLERGNMICLSTKKTNFGAGKLNGYGGKIEKNETIVDCIVREILEESTVVVSPEKCELVGELYMKVTDNEEWKETAIYVFKISVFIGEPIETNEMKPEWYMKDSIPYENMWISDQKWFPTFLDGKKFVGHFTLSEAGVLNQWNIKEIGDEKKYKIL